MKRRTLKIVHVTSDFEKSCRKLPDSILEHFKKKDRWFRDNAFDPRLHTHRLKGPLQNYWAYSVTHHYRVLFRFVQDDEALYYDIGTHSIYR